MKIERHFSAPDQERFDKQGDLPDKERVKRAVTAFVRDFDGDTSGYMESCVHCGLCAEACHFYEASGGEAQYTPIYKIKPFERAYKREVGPFAWLHKMISRPVSVDELQEWQHLIYDSCTMCGRCSMVCPMGIDIPALIHNARHGMWAAGLAPKRMSEIVANAERNEGSQSANPKEFAEIIARMSKDTGYDIPLDEDEAEVMLTIPAGVIESDGEEVVAMGKILDAAGYSWTLSTKGYEATNFGMLSGFVDLQKKYTMRIVNAAESCKAKIVLLPECGHAYGALRWKGPDWYGKPFPFEVLHMSEFLGKLVREKKIKLKKVGDELGKVTYHDPCQAGRRGGIFDAPREVMDALGLKVEELPGGQEYNYCCGGGGGALANRRNIPFRHEVFKIKIKQVEKTGADTIVSACHQCHITFEQGMKAHNWEKPFESLMELVAHHLDT